MSKTLVIILSETRAHELTFANFKKNVVDELNADLCLCIGVKPDYDYTNPFYQLAKHKFLYEEPDDFGVAFDYAYNLLTKNAPRYERFENLNTLYGKLDHPLHSTENIRHYANIDEDNIDLSLSNVDDDEIVIHTKKFPDESCRGQTYGIRKKIDGNDVKQEHVITYKRRIHWREFLKIKFQFLGGIRDPQYQHPGSAGILIFFRWVLLQNLIHSDLINQYDRFVITRSDFIYELPHPKLELMQESNIWIPDSEHYGGYTDRHVVLSRRHVEPYLNILTNMVLQSNEYFQKMRHKDDWNLEQLIYFHLEQNGVRRDVKGFPYIMYSARGVNGTSTWATGVFSESHGYFIKYLSEFVESFNNKNSFQASGYTIDDFYKSAIDECCVARRSFGFIILRHVICKSTNKYWIHCYNCIRKYYPENYILIIDDNSNYEFITNEKLYKTAIINSEYPGRGELLPYYYYLHNKIFDIAVILHDSTFISKYIDFDVDKYKFLWEFEHYWDQIEDELRMIHAFNDAELTEFYEKKSSWKGCFGAMTVIAHDYLVEVNNKYEIRKLLNLVLNRYNRCSFERVIACLLQKTEKMESLFGNIHLYCGNQGTTTFNDKHTCKHLPIIKVWTGR